MVALHVPRGPDRLGGDEEGREEPEGEQVPAPAREEREVRGAVAGSDRAERPDEREQEALLIGVVELVLLLLNFIVSIELLQLVQVVFVNIYMMLTLLSTEQIMVRLSLISPLQILEVF